MSRCLYWERGANCPSEAMDTELYCTEHQPGKSRQLAIALIEEEKKSALKALERRERREQRAELQAAQLEEEILEIKTLEDLRRVELLCMQAMVNNSFDPRAAGALVQLCKHQAELIYTAQNEGGENVKPEEREVAITLAAKLSIEDALGLLGNFSIGMKALVKQAKADTVPMLTVDADA